ncbi:hypothetical protein JWG45_01380 [Leptospira sp. 201903070]|uniref:Uncharacterized protein n=1 Tax=Leptospira ainlahdjerensis TaxID=2810033 RepID=A0ABS2U7M7_9LEPT|nr:hypothetical protein [Leptospira ainlahdjerensis]MBM9575794.1 hypothetical protein [Leptospira ainlahdjerensis]
MSQILATKGHPTSEDLDTNIFLDADLSILGEEWDLYSGYCKNIRKEYSIYSDSDYKIGREECFEILHRDGSDL